MDFDKLFEKIDLDKINFDEIIREIKVVDKRDSDILVAEAEKRGDIQKVKDIRRIDKFYNQHMRKINNVVQMNFVPDVGEECRLITQGSFNMFTILIYFIQKYKKIDELYITTFNMKESVISTIFDLLERDTIEKLRIMISESIVNRMPKRAAQLKELTIKNSEKYDVRLKMNWNHSKIMLAKFGDIYYVMEGSGNLSDNAQIEQYIVTNSEGIYNFHKSWMDDCFSQNILKRDATYG